MSHTRTAGGRPDQSFSTQPHYCPLGEPLFDLLEPSILAFPRPFLFPPQSPCQAPAPLKMPTGHAQPQAGAAGLPCAVLPRRAAARCRAPGAPLRGTHHTWPSHRPHSKTPSSGGTRAPMRNSQTLHFFVPPPFGPLYPCQHPTHGHPTLITSPSPPTPSPGLTGPRLGPPCLHGWGRREGGQPLR